jgi:hypothetical protein
MTAASAATEDMVGAPLLTLFILNSVGDPDPDPDPHVFGPSGSGCINQRYGFEDPDPHQNVTDPQHRFLQR